MSLQSNYNAVATITRKTRSVGSDDGTPVYVESAVVVAGWFDEIDIRGFDTPTRDGSVSFMDRRGKFMCDGNADVQQDDEMLITIGGVSRGVWQVSIIRPAPVPVGISHLELQVQGVKEGH